MTTPSPAELLFGLPIAPAPAVCPTVERLTAEMIAAENAGHWQKVVALCQALNRHECGDWCWKP